MSDPEAMRQRAAEQSNAQWAVRWHGVVLFALLIASVPVLHLAWHVLAGMDEPMVPTRNQRPRPPLTQTRTRAGQWQWTLDLERWLQEASPVVWWLRGTYNEMRYRCGIFASDSVTCGREGWLFMSQSLYPDARRLAGSAADRARFLAKLRRRTDQLGVQLLVVVCPDKERIYPDLIYGDGHMPPEKERLYPAILRDLAAAGIASVDLWQPIAGLRQGSAEELYYRRDSHWRPACALFAGQVVAAALEQGAAAPLLGPKSTVELQAPLRARVLPDIAALAGFCAFEKDLGPGVGMGSMPASKLTADLTEVKEYYSLAVRTPTGSRPIKELAGDSAILLAGTSFSAEAGADALQFALQRPVRQVVRAGAAGTNSLAQALHELATGASHAKVLVWEFVERGYLEDAWVRPDLPGL